MHGEGTDRKVRAVAFYPTHGRAPPGPPPPPVFFERAFSRVKTPKRASRDGAAARGAAPRGPTCTARPDLPTGGVLAGRSGLAVHLGPTRRPVRPPQGRFGRVRGSPEADFGPASPLGGAEVHGDRGSTPRVGLYPVDPRSPCTLVLNSPPQLAAPLPSALGAPGVDFARGRLRPLHHRLRGAIGAVPSLSTLQTLPARRPTCARRPSACRTGWNQAAARPAREWSMQGVIGRSYASRPSGWTRWPNGTEKSEDLG